MTESKHSQESGDAPHRRDTQKWYVRHRTLLVLVIGNLIPLVWVLLSDGYPSQPLMMYWLEAGVIGCFGFLLLCRWLGESNPKDFRRHGLLLVFLIFLPGLPFMWCILGPLIAIPMLDPSVLEPQQGAIPGGRPPSNPDLTPAEVRARHEKRSREAAAARQNRTVSAEQFGKVGLRFLLAAVLCIPLAIGHWRSFRSTNSTVRDKNLWRVILEPQGRFLVVLLAIIFGGLLMQRLQDQRTFAVLLVLLKTLLDVLMYGGEHGWFPFLKRWSRGDFRS